jgi:hypothetical protein
MMTIPGPPDPPEDIAVPPPPPPLFVVPAVPFPLTVKVPGEVKA